MPFVGKMNGYERIRKDREECYIRDLRILDFPISFSIRAAPAIRIVCHHSHHCSALIFSHETPIDNFVQFVI